MALLKIKNTYIKNFHTNFYQNTLLVDEKLCDNALRVIYYSGKYTTTSSYIIK